MELGSLCSDFDKRAINDTDLCVASAIELKALDQRTNFKKVETTSDWPPGCYLTNAGIYFNENTTGNRNPKAHPICRTGIQTIAM